MMDLLGEKQIITIDSKSIAFLRGLREIFEPRMFFYSSSSIKFEIEALKYLKRFQSKELCMMSFFF